MLTTEAGTRAEHFYRTDGWTEVGRKEDGQIIFQKSLLGPLVPARASTGLQDKGSWEGSSGLGVARFLDRRRHLNPDHRAAGLVKSRESLD